MVPFFRAKKKKANVPTLGTRFLVKFLRVGEAMEVKCPTNARDPPIGFNIDSCIMFVKKIYFYKLAFKQVI